MAQVLVRDLPRDVVDRLKIKAARQGESLESYLRTVLEEASEFDRDEILAIADAIAARNRGRNHTDAVELVRRGRDSRP